MYVCFRESIVYVCFRERLRKPIMYVCSYIYIYIYIFISSDLCLNPSLLPARFKEHRGFMCAERGLVTCILV
jgi:hypothetical protein